MKEKETEQWRKKTLEATTECNQLTLGCKTTEQVARRLRMSARALFRELQERGILFKDCGMWMLEPAYVGLGLLLYRYTPYYALDGELKIRTYPVWTKRGQEFLEDTLCEV